MRLNTYEEIRHAFVEGNITKQKFIELAEPFSAAEMLCVERKHHSVIQKVVNFFLPK